MSFRKCISDKAAKGLIGKGKAREFLAEYDELVERYTSTMGSEQAAIKAATDKLDAEVRIAQEKRRREILAVQANKRIMAKLEQSGKPLDTATRDLYERAATRGQGIARQAFSMVNEFVEEFRSKNAGLTRGNETLSDAADRLFAGDTSSFDSLKNVIREILGEDSGDSAAKAFGRAISKTNDYLHSRYRAAGGILGKLDNYIPQVHSRDAIKLAARKAGLSIDEFKPVWIKRLRESVDIDRMIDERTGLPFSESALAKQMSDDFDAIISGGASEILKRTKSGKAPFKKSRELTEKRINSRFYQFKDAESFLNYNRDFGVGDDGLFDLITGHVGAMSKDIGILEVLGPKPRDLRDLIDLNMSAKDIGKVKQAHTNAMFEVLIGATDGEASDHWTFRAIANTANWIRSSLLGSAVLSAIGDIPVARMTAKMNGLDSFNVAKNFTALLNPTNKTHREIASRAGYIAEIANGTAVADARFFGENLGGKFTSQLANLTVRASGLQHWTKSWADAIAMEAEGQIADFVSKGVRFKDLPDDFRTALEGFDVTAKDWEIISNAKAFEVPDRGIKFMRSQDIAMAKGFDAKSAQLAASKIDDWIFHMRAVATNEPGLRTRAITTGAITGGDARRGTIARTFFGSATMLKSFPITVMFNHLMPAIQRAKQGKFDNLATLTLGTAVFGAFAIQLKELAKGKSPKDWDNPEFMAAALLQGGGLGLFGDFFFQDYSRFGREPLVEAFGGPMLGLVDDIMRTAKGNIDRSLADEKTKFSKDLFRLVKRNIPVMSSLWYTRLATERLLFDQIDRMIDEKYDRRLRRYARKMKKETGQKFYWEPGATTPLGF